MNPSSLAALVLLPLISWQSVSATSSTFILADKKQNTAAHTLVKILPTPDAKSWATSRLGYLSTELKSAKKLNGDRSDAQAYRTEISAEITHIIESIQKNTIVFSVSDSLRKSVEKDVISYQKSFADAIKVSIQNSLLSDMRETGDMHFTLKSKQANVAIDINPYKVVLSKDRKNIEIDTKIIASVDAGKEGSASGMIDGNIKLIGSDLYLTLRDYKIGTTLIGNQESDDIIKTLSEIKGKTYHQKLSNDLSEMMSTYEKDPTASIKKINQALDIISTESLLTPIATEGSDTILMFRKETIQKIMALMPDSESSLMTEGLSDVDMIIPADIRTDGKTISLKAYENGSNLQASLSHHTDGTPLFSLDIRDRGVKNPTHMTLSKTPTFWALAASSDGYTVDAQASSVGATATVKNGSKTIATAKINSTGVDAWTYDLGAIWDWTNYNYETDTDETESIAMRIWGNIRDEFGSFQIAPPTIAEELEKTTLGAKNAKSERDSKRISDIYILSDALYAYRQDTGKNLIPKNGCLDTGALVKYIPEDTALSTNIMNGVDTCASGYFYSLISSYGKKVPLLAIRVESPDRANYDNNTKSISTVKMSSKLSLYGEISSQDPKDWLYVYQGYNY